jgi:hypothetical protein
MNYRYTPVLWRKKMLSSRPKVPLQYPNMCFEQRHNYTADKECSGGLKSRLKGPKRENFLLAFLHKANSSGYVIKGTIFCRTFTLCI